FDFKEFLTQRELIDTHLSTYLPELQKMADMEYPIVEQAALLWNIIYTRVIQYMNVHKDWLYLRHEDVSAQPEEHFEKILTHLGIPLSQNIEKMLRETTSSKRNRNTVEESLRDSVYRDSRDNINSWKGRLTASEVDFIRGYTRPVWSHFYDESDW